MELPADFASIPYEEMTEFPVFAPGLYAFELKEATLHTSKKGNKGITQVAAINKLYRIRVLTRFV